jgi:GTP-binding protein HflX
MGLGALPAIEVFNKVDVAEDPSALKWVRDHKPEGVLISARKGIGIESLLSRMKDAYDAGRVTVETLVNPADGKFWNELYRVGEILSSQPEGEAVRIRVTMDRPNARRLGLINGSDPSRDFV